MAHITYILYSESLDRFYIGSSSESIDVRLDRHNSRYYDNSWSIRGIPWTIFLVIDCASQSQAHGIESHIERMKSKVYVRNLVVHPEMIDKLKQKYS